MTTPITLIQLGLGGVGRALVEQIHRTRAAQARHGVRLELCALADSSGALGGAALSDERLAALCARKAAGGRLDGVDGAQVDGISALVEALAGPRTLIVDTTAADSDLVQPLFERVLAAGGAVALANKKPLAAAWASWERLTGAGQTGYEATVGAGLPVISTLRALLDTGDEVQRIEGAFSGTLGFLMSELQEGRPFGAIVRDAKGRGWTEPDPRDDLSGTDVARKALILARTLGQQVGLEDVRVTALFPEEWAALSLAGFMARLDELDPWLAAQRDEAHGAGQRLRYAATVSAAGLVVGPQAMPPDSALGALRGPDNLIAFRTARYAARPLVVQGAGAGVEVTASALLSDILRLASVRA